MIGLFMRVSTFAKNYNIQIMEKHKALFIDIVMEYGPKLIGQFYS